LIKVALAKNEFLTYSTKDLQTPEKYKNHVTWYESLQIWVDSNI